LLAADAARPLAGVRIVVTRAKEQARHLSQRLSELGAIVLSLPAITFAEPRDCTLLDSAIASLHEFGWILFTSTNAVRFFAARCRASGTDPTELAGAPGPPKVAAVGPATAKAITTAGFAVDYVATEFRGEALARELSAHIHRAKILLPRSDRAADELPKALREAGADVTEVVAYRTIEVTQNDESAEALNAIRAGRVDIVAFFSPSAFHSIEAQIERRDLQHAALAAIGPVTAAAVRAAGFTVAIEAREATTDGFIAALVEHFASKASQGART
jgi:uroporphyrinogen-III synthase